MERNPTCHANKILNHSAKPPSCGLLAVNGPIRQIAVILTKTFLPAEAQQIVCQQSQRHYVGVAGKMLTWKSFQSHVSLYLRMKLLGGAVVMLMKDDIESIVERSPVGINFQLRNNKALFFFSSPFSNIKNYAQWFVITNKNLRKGLQNTKWALGQTKKKLSACASRYLRLLRDHGLIKKLPEQNKYQMTTRGIKTANILNAFLAASTQELMKMAA
jgi:hypothetical protein